MRGSSTPQIKLDETLSSNRDVYYRIRLYLKISKIKQTYKNSFIYYFIMNFRLLRQGRIIECPDCQRRMSLRKRVEDIVFLKCTCGLVLISKMFKDVK